MITIVWWSKKTKRNSSTTYFEEKLYNSRLGLGLTELTSIDLFSFITKELNMTKKEFASYELCISNLSVKSLTGSHSLKKIFNNITKTIFGRENKQKICSMVGLIPSKTTKRKHQISLLYYQVQLMY